MAKHVLLDVAPHVGASVSDGAMLFDVLYELAAHILKSGPEETLQLIQHGA